MASENTFVAAMPIQACIDEFTARNQMPTARRFGMWVEVTAITAGEEYVIICRLVFGKGQIRRVADVEARLVKLSAETTQVTTRVINFNWTAGAVFGVLGTVGALLVLAATRNTSGALCLFAGFAALALFGVVLAATQYRDARRLPAAIRDWLTAAPELPAS